jgi:hypothetical protein
MFEVSENTSAKFTYGEEAAKPGYSRKTFRVKPPAHNERMVIAWDMEGISLSGQHRPQHAVLFGCSAETEAALEGQRLETREMLEYIISVGERYPHAIHVGFAFKYDANMLIFGLSERQITKLWKNGSITFGFDDVWTWYLRLVPGKMFTLSRRRRGTRANTRAKTSVTIYDYSSFFGQTFIATAEQILGDDMSDDDRDVIAHGKAARGKQSWSDMPEIRHYWQREIQLIRRVFEKFRDVMWQAGFSLREWYGPGALANYINATKQIRPQLAGVQTTSGVMPHAVHEASKVAFSGGRFELFMAGRVQGPIYAIDINSAYPYALTQVPSLHPDNGEWVHVERPDHVSQFGVYRIRFVAPNATPFEYRPMPLFWRDHRGMISYPSFGEGWYWSPEAQMMLGAPGIEILEGWEWKVRTDERPWTFLQDMYDTRMRLGKKNLLSMPFKLGPNSLYGKYAQTVGWDQRKKLPPKSHALPVAGWVTSYCRAMLFTAMRKAPSKIVAVETDAIYSLVPPDELGVVTGDGLGEWGYEIYDEMIYIQSGMYHYKKGGEWKGVRSRGISRAEYPVEMAIEYVSGLKAGEKWGPLKLTTKPRFIGAGAALASSAPTKAVMTSWVAMQKEMTLGETGKRMHVPNACPQCLAGVDPWEQPHRLMVQSRSTGRTMSRPRALPWESAYTSEVETIRKEVEIESQLLER